jgi:ABC-type arginine transport system ATPase subunit
VSYFKRLENLEKIRCTNSQNPFSLLVDNKKRVSVTSGVGKFFKNQKWSNMWFHFCVKNNHNTADCRVIAMLKQQKRSALKGNLNLNEVSGLPFRRNKCTQKAVEA